MPLSRAAWRGAGVCAAAFLAAVAQFSAGAAVQPAVVTARPATSDAQPKSVLVIYSNGRLLPANFEVDRGIRAAISTSTVGPVALYDEFLDQPRFEGDTYEQTVATYLRDKYAARSIDVVIAAGQTALTFVMNHRASLFPRVPLVHAVVDDLFLRSNPALRAQAVGVPTTNLYMDTIDAALRLHPQARRLVVVTGASRPDRVLEAGLRRNTERLRSRLTLEFLVGLPTDAVLKRLRQLGNDSVVFTPGHLEAART
jgi:hypothetical protein